PADLQTLHELGFRSAAMALEEDSLSLDELAARGDEKLALILGTEGHGLSPRTLAACNDTVMIPMSHGVDSLNVAAASAVAFWETRPR
ncbi:MAG: rRNA methyltransferase, partial [Rothia mucilaginosa]